MVLRHMILLAESATGQEHVAEVGEFAGGPGARPSVPCPAGQGPNVRTTKLGQEVWQKKLHVVEQAEE